MSLNLNQLTPPQRAALRRVVQWSILRRDVLNDLELEASGWLEPYQTVLGLGVILSRAACQVLGVSARERSGTVLTTALYLQDASDVLASHHLTHLQPGEAPYYTVQNARGTICPLLGRVALRGYHQPTVKRHMQDLAGDLLVRGASLIVVHPEPDPFRYRHDRLILVHAPPHWES